VSEPDTQPTPVAGELERSAALIEQLLADPELRRRFRSDPAPVLRDHGLAGLAAGLPPGRKALMTLELRESRSSLAGAMVAAAAEGVDVAHVAEHMAPVLEHNAGHMIGRLIHSFSHHAARHLPPAVKHKVAAPVEPGVPPLAPKPVPPNPMTPAYQVQTPAAPAAVAVAPAGVAATVAQPSNAGEVASYGSQHASEAASQQAPQQAAAAPRTPATATAPVDPTHAAGQGAASAPPVAEPPEPQGTSLTYPGNEATPQQLAAWMGTEAERAGLPPELPVMAALTESGLHNLSYGDRDSVGFFQMRLGIWNNGLYAGYPNDPELQMKWFIDHALAARADDPGLADNPETWGQWVANIEQPAAQYRYRYQLQLDAARELLAGADLTPVAPAPPVPVGDEALQVAMKYLGTPYQWGGSTPATGFDCSGLVQYAYAQEGVQLPRVAAEQFDVGIPVSRNDLEPGDAVFFANPDGDVHHVGLYIGDGKFVDAPETGEDVRVDSLSEPYFAAQYAGARRFTTAALGNPATYARTMPAVGSGG